MSLISFEGFDIHTDISLTDASVTNPTGASFVAGRFGGKAISIHMPTSQVCYVCYSLPYPLTSTTVLGVAVKWKALSTTPPTSFIHMLLGGFVSSFNQVGIGINALRNLEIFRGANFASKSGTTLGTGTAVIELDTFYYIEIKLYVHATAGTVKVYVDGVLDFTFTGKTNGQTGTTIQYVGIVGGDNNTVLFDDLYMDTVDVLGPQRVTSVYPVNDTAQKDFTPSSGTSNFALLGTRDDAEYVSTSTSNHEDLYTCGNVTVTFDTIKAVSLIAVAKKVETTSKTLTLELKQDIVYPADSDITLSDSYRPYQKIFLTNPETSAAWTSEAINDLQIGMKGA